MKIVRGPLFRSIISFRTALVLFVVCDKVLYSQIIVYATLKLFRFFADGLAVSGSILPLLELRLGLEMCGDSLPSSLNMEESLSLSLTFWR